MKSMKSLKVGIGNMMSAKGFADEYEHAELRAAVNVVKTAPEADLKDVLREANAMSTETALASKSIKFGSDDHILLIAKANREKRKKLCIIFALLSALGIAGIVGGIANCAVKPGAKVLYLGGASGTTVSHVHFALHARSSQVWLRPGKILASSWPLGSLPRQAPVDK